MEEIDLHLLILPILEDSNTTGGSMVIFGKFSLRGEGDERFLVCWVFGSRGGGASKSGAG